MRGGLRWPPPSNQFAIRSSRRQHLSQVERLLQEPHACGHPRIAISRSNDHPQVRKLSLRKLGNVGTVALAGQTEVRDDQIQLLAEMADDQFSRLGALAVDHLEPLVLEELAQHFALRFVVFDDKRQRWNGHGSLQKTPFKNA